MYKPWSEVYNFKQRSTVYSGINKEVRDRDKAINSSSAIN